MGTGQAMRPAAATDRLPAVRAVRRAFDLLAVLGTEQRPATLSELARGSALPISTAARLLATLEQAGFVRREGGGYAAGLRLLQVGLAALRGTSLYDLAEPHLQRLSRGSGETANLAVRISKAQAIYLRQVVSPRSIHHASWLGRVLPLRRTAIGAALLGRVNASGYVVRRNTLERDVTAVAAPVHGPSGEIVAAFSITGPSYRIGEKEVERFGTQVVEEARRASAALGASPLES